MNDNEIITEDTAYVNKLVKDSKIQDTANNIAKQIEPVSARRCAFMFLVGIVYTIVSSLFLGINNWIYFAILILLYIVTNVEMSIFQKSIFKMIKGQKVNTNLSAWILFITNIIMGAGYIIVVNLLPQSTDDSLKVAFIVIYQLYLSFMCFRYDHTISCRLVHMIAEIRRTGTQ